MPKVTLKESDRALAMRRAAMMAAKKGGKNGLMVSKYNPMGIAMGFEADDPASLKAGIMAMEQQLKDMEAHPNRYINALRSGYTSGFCFGGDLFGIPVPKILETGEVPSGMTPSQAFQQVLDYMRKVLEAACNGLPDETSKNAGAFRAPAGLLESVDRLIISTGSWGSYKK